MDDKKARLPVARFLFEASILKKVLRTGYPFLGKGEESVAAHTFGVLMAAFALAKEFESVDMERLLQLCLFHDLTEARTGDANAVHKLYVTIDEDKAARDMTRELGWGREIYSILKEYREAESLEAQIAHDADQIDMLLSLKEHLDTGSEDAALWIPYVKARLRTLPAKRLADFILSEHWAAWWMRDLLGKDFRKSRNKKEE